MIRRNYLAVSALSLASLAGCVSTKTYSPRQLNPSVNTSVIQSLREEAQATTQPSTQPATQSSDLEPRSYSPKELREFEEDFAGLSPSRKEFMLASPIVEEKFSYSIGGGIITQDMVRNVKDLSTLLPVGKSISSKSLILGDERSPLSSDSGIVRFVAYEGDDGLRDENTPLTENSNFSIEITKNEKITRDLYHFRITLGTEESRFTAKLDTTEQYAVSTLVGGAISAGTPGGLASLLADVSLNNVIDHAVRNSRPRSTTYITGADNLIDAPEDIRKASVKAMVENSSNYNLIVCDRSHNVTFVVSSTDPILNVNSYVGESGHPVIEGYVSQDAGRSVPVYLLRQFIHGGSRLIPQGSWNGSDGSGVTGGRNGEGPGGGIRGGSSGGSSGSPGGGIR